MASYFSCSLCDFMFWTTPTTPVPSSSMLSVVIFTIHHHTGHITQHKSFVEHAHLTWKRVWREADRNGTAVLCARVASVAEWKKDMDAAFAVARPVALDSSDIVNVCGVDGSSMLVVRFADAPGRRRSVDVGLWHA